MQNLFEIEGAKKLEEYIPDEVSSLENPQTDIPRIAKDKELIHKIESAARQIPSNHELVLGDARKMSFIEDKSVHLIVTSPPYWTLKKYNDNDSQLGEVEDYEQFLLELDRVWKHCYRVLAQGGRLCCVVGDVCLSRRKNNGRHTVVPLHSSIQEHCRIIGYDNLSPIIWYKIANASFESNGNGGGFLGKPYEPNSVIKNDIEYVLMERKPGGYRKPTIAKRILSIISDKNHKEWFRSIWSGLTGASTKNHPAPYPIEMAERLIRMFSFVGDTVLDPFMGTGSTNIAAAKWGRNSIGVEIDPKYFEYAEKRIFKHASPLFSNIDVRSEV